MCKRLIISILIIMSSISLVSCSDGNKNNLQEYKETVSIEENSNGYENKRIIDKKEIINELTSDKYEGRLVGSKGNELVEEYLNNIFNDLNLKPVFDDAFKHEYSQEVSETYGLISDEDEVKIKNVNNIVGKIEGEKSDNAIIISAHFDHIGKQDDKIIRGAIDNASGVSVLLDLIEELNIKFSNSKPPFDIIFCAFNGEEKGLEGSRNFIEDIKDRYINMININIDSVGYINGGNITFLNKKDHDKINNLMKQSLENNNLNVSENSSLKGMADSQSFENAGIESICIVEENVKEVIHSLEDTIDKVDYEILDNIVKSIINFIDKYHF